MSTQLDIAARLEALTRELGELRAMLEPIAILAMREIERNEKWRESGRIGGVKSGAVRGETKGASTSNRSTLRSRARAQTKHPSIAHDEHDLKQENHSSNSESKGASMQDAPLLYIERGVDPPLDRRKKGTRKRGPKTVERDTIEAPFDSAGYAQIVAAFFDRYQGAYGSKPHWSGKEGKMIKALMIASDVAEILRRLEIMFTKPPSWLRPPFDPGTFVQHFNKFVIASDDIVRRSPQLPPGVGRYEPEDNVDPRPPWDFE